MKAAKLVLLLSGWLAFLYLSFCAPAGGGGEIPDIPVGSADASDWDSDAGSGQPSLDKGGGIYVLDASGRLVGWLISRSHRLYENKELYDAITVYNTDFDLFFSIKMSNGEVLLPAKIMFSNGSCTGTVGVRATCAKCVTGYELAFSYNGTWHRVDGGRMPEAMNYVTYAADVPGESTCISHGGSSTQVYRTTPMPEGMNPGSFDGPLEFRWAGP